MNRLRALFTTSAIPAPPIPAQRQRRATRVVSASRPRQPLRPTPAQLARARALAITRDMSPGVVTTRGERDQAIRQIFATCTRAQASEAIRLLATRDVARAWVERTPAFKRAHAEQVARLQGLDAPEGGAYYTYAAFCERRGLAPRATTKAVAYADLSDDDRAIVDSVLGRRAKRPTAREVREWWATRDVVDDPTWGPVCVGEWA